MLDPIQLTEQLDPDTASLLPCPVPLGQATPRADCYVVPMLSPTSDNPTHLAQHILRPRFPLPPPWAQTEALSPKSNGLEIEIRSGKELWQILF
jgi:hypothetical protein